MPPALRAVVDAAARTFRSLTFDRRMAAGLFALMALLPLVSPLLGGTYLLHIGERALILGLAAISLGLLIGVAGMVSFGHAAFLGIGAYAAGIAASHGLGTLSVALPAALAASALFALATGAIAVRTHGVYFIMITLAFGQMAFFVATSLAPYGGDDGLSWPTRTLVLGTRLLEHETVFFYVTLAVALAAYVLVSRLTAARFGRVLRGLTASEPRMQAIGFAPYRFRLTAYVIAGALCGLAGFLLGNHAEFVSPAYMHWQRSGELIVAVLLGGTGTVYGPLLGAVAFVLLEETLSRLTEHWKAILGPILVIVVLFAKGGMAGGIEQAVARWRRRRMTPRELIAVLPALAEQRVAGWSAAAAARFRALESATGRQLDRLTVLGRQSLAEAGARWEPWGRSIGRQLGAMGAMAERGLAHLIQGCRSLALALERRLDGLLLRIKAGAAEARARWHRWKMALGRRLVSLALSAERRVAGAAGRWRRR
jgi:branched-chain amino acid transport system permease protein